MITKYPGTLLGVLRVHYGVEEEEWTKGERRRAKVKRRDLHGVTKEGEDESL